MRPSGTPPSISRTMAPMDSPVNIKSEEHTSELPSLMRLPYALFCLKKKTQPEEKDGETDIHAEVECCELMRHEPVHQYEVRDVDRDHPALHEDQATVSSSQHEGPTEHPRYPSMSHDAHGRS